MRIWAAGAITFVVLLAAGGCGRSSHVGLASHDNSFAVAGSHRPFSCAQCHDPVAPGFALADQGVSCVGCHTDGTTTAAHAAVASYSWANGSCIACHKDGRGGLPANHNADFFPVTGTKHAALGCADCHGPTKAIADITCMPCHAQTTMATTHALIPPSMVGRSDGKTYLNYQWASASCLKCHADGQVNRIASHPSVPHGLTGEGHAPFCLTCHTTVAPPGGKIWAVDFSKYSCLACHSSNNPG